MALREPHPASSSLNAHGTVARRLLPNLERSLLPAAGWLSTVFPVDMLTLTNEHTRKCSSQFIVTKTS